MSLWNVALALLFLLGLIIRTTLQMISVQKYKCVDDMGGFVLNLIFAINVYLALGCAFVSQWIRIKELEKQLSQRTKPRSLSLH